MRFLGIPSPDGLTRRLGCSLLTLAGCAVLAGCQRTSSDAADQAPSPTAGATASAVQVVTPERQTVRQAIEQPGFNIEAYQETSLYARITGYVRTWHVDIGDPIRKDQVLAELYVPEMAVDLRQKEAAIRQAAAQVEQSRAIILNAQAQLERAQSQHERLARAGRSGTLDQENVDEARLSYEAAKAGREKARADLTAAEAYLEVAKASRDYAQAMLDYAQIRAPYDGVVTQRNVNTGDFVLPAGTGSKGQALFVVNQIDPVRVFVNVPGAHAAWVRDGDPVSLRLQGAGGELFQGKVTRNARSLNPQARTLRTEIDVPNPQDKLLPGMYVQAVITVQHEGVWTLPATAVLTEGDQTFCYRVESGKAVRTPLQVGLRGGGLVEVLKQQTRPPSAGDEWRWEELTGSEEIVANGAAVSNDGQVVQRGDK